MRRWLLVSLMVTAGLVPAPSLEGADDRTATTACEARSTVVEQAYIRWHHGPPEDAAALTAWCRAVGTPLVAIPSAPSPSGPPTLDELVVVTWNAHLGDGRLPELIEDLRSGALTGAPVQHFVLLIQELYRHGDDVPEFTDGARSAFAITSGSPEARDAHEYVESLGLSMTYVPSMRNGIQLPEDRGNAIVSTEPLEDLFALELPLERQRRVVAGAAIDVETEDGTIEKLHLVNAHLEPLSSPETLWIFRNPRPRQLAAILRLVQQPDFAEDALGVVLGGDLNTVQGGARESVYRTARLWSRSLDHEDPRDTHLMGRLDYVFARLDDGWRLDTLRVDEKYGSDHHPVLGRFHR